MTFDFDRAALDEAGRLVYADMNPTPQYCWPLLCERSGAEVWVKHENHTPTGAFKVRGGLVYLHAYRQRVPEGGGLISATRGNHGQSLAFSCRRHATPLTIVAPRGNSSDKNAAMRAFGAELLELGEDFDESRGEAARLAAERGLEMVPPFHPDLVRGVATYALELFSHVTNLHTVYVPIGMGSGICGLIRTRDLLGLDTRIVGVVSRGAPAFARSFVQGEIVTTPTADTLADGMACRMPLAEALDIVRRGAERIVEVSDDEIGQAIAAYYRDTHNLVEGAGAAPLAALLQERTSMAGKKVGLIATGGNIDYELFTELMNRGVTS